MADSEVVVFLIADPLRRHQLLCSVLFTSYTTTPALGAWRRSHLAGKFPPMTPLVVHMSRGLEHGPLHMTSGKVSFDHFYAGSQRVMTGEASESVELAQCPQPVGHDFDPVVLSME